MKKIVSFAFAAVLMIAVCVFPSSANEGSPFNDVPESAWCYAPVLSVFDAGIMNGTASGEFSPDSPVTRGQTVTILARLSGEDFSGSGAYAPFSDVPPGEYYADPVGWAVGAEIAKGRGGGIFAPDEPVLRQEFAAFFSRYLRYMNIGSPENEADPFRDAVPEWARDDIETLHRLGFMKGDENGSFNPEEKMTRAEIATVSSRFIAEIQNSNRSDRVVLIGVDGGGAFFRDADTPNMDRIFAGGAVSHSVLTSIPTISAQCWGSMLHGVTPEIHRLTNSTVQRREFNPDSPFPSVFRVIRDSDPSATLASFCNWTPINHGIIEEGIGVYKDGGSDREITDKICEYVKDHDPKLLFVQFDEVDEAGHSSGYGSENHLKKITEEDENVGRIYEAYREAGLLDGTLFIVTADHGGSGTGHGGSSDAEKYVTFAAAGRSVEPGDIRDMEIRDTAAIVLYALGLGKPSTWTARVPAGVFRNVPAGRRQTYETEFSVPHRTHESVPTPSIDALRSVLGERGIRLYMPLDGSVADATGNNDVKKLGKIYYPDGFFGSGAAFDDGFPFVRNMPFKDGSFSVCFWMKCTQDADGLRILGNSTTSGGRAKGFALRKWSEDLSFTLYDGEESEDVYFFLPSDYPGGWVHVALSFDAGAGTVSVCCDFGEIVTRKITDGPLVSPDGGDALWIANDEGDNWGFPGTFDEFLILDGVLTRDDLDALAEYYGVGD